MYTNIFFPMARYVRFEMVNTLLLSFVTEVLGKSTYNAHKNCIYKTLRVLVCLMYSLLSVYLY